MKKISSSKMVIFDHDGTLVDTETPDFKVFPGIKELLVDLNNAGFEMAVWTARSHRSTVESLKNADIASFFGEIYGHDDGISKPHPMGLSQITNGIDRESVIHIGDSLGDLDGANAFGIAVIAACWNSTNQVEIFKRKTPFVAMTPADCKVIIAKKFNVNL
ncbi:HAD-IA family hydrolase [Bacteriovorax sp. PP10]|uniref:phosphoglycolate phosphatase n=1 Tax=Bacteriovorax antarcticus TaxID=3088717 RepID=A0ABU5VTS0_9BACT|nr:HAD-IA family hydrolase [Bacteriovorax sp. PP10]MEA9356456.1 HAD-IA family hydrolase [Bacteriovorax sp. PP10]